ncbi:hypothetical protein PRUPE_1G022100 [Prunus persica]|uniref:Uncharacterized protein n=1 Tax=Prunus persica TaxID=3760 RepID=A0A251QUJ8_PRUPE|nr:uncharacterized protein LOC18790585 [Prunus persica]ONI26395.1 hypothetical protein PRUPE_1G022100 [Prunus persica]
MENENISDQREESGVPNQDSQSLDLEALQATSELNKFTMDDKGSASISTEEIVGRDQRTELVVEEEKSPNMSGVLLGRTEGLKSEEEDAVKAKFLNGKENSTEDGSVCGQENSTEDGAVADQQGLHPPLHSEIAEQKHAADSELRHSCSSEGDGKEIVGSDEIVKGEVVESVFLNEKMVGSDENLGLITGSGSVGGQEKTENGKGVVTDQQDLNNLVPEISEKEQIGSGSGSSLSGSGGVTDQNFEFGMRADDVTADQRANEADESNQEWRDIKEAIMRADQLDLESIGLKIERRVRASVEDMVRYPQMNSKTMSLSIGDWERILEADQVPMQRELGELKKKNVEITFENLSLEAQIDGEQRKMQALKALSEYMEGKLGVIKEAELDKGKTIAELEEETKTEVEKEKNEIHELQELVNVEESKETELKVEMPSKTPGLLHRPKLLMSAGIVITAILYTALKMKRR